MNTFCRHKRNRYAKRIRKNIDRHRQTISVPRFDLLLLLLYQTCRRRRDSNERIRITV